MYIFVCYYLLLLLLSFVFLLSFLLLVYLVPAFGYHALVVVIEVVVEDIRKEYPEAAYLYQIRKMSKG